MQVWIAQISAKLSNYCNTNLIFVTQRVVPRRSGDSDALEEASLDDEVWRYSWRLVFATGSKPPTLVFTS